MPRFIHVGCGRFTKANTTGTFSLPVWDEVRYDIDPAVAPDVTGTMTDMSAIPSGSMDGLYSAHNIEHLYPHDVPVALKEFHRVLSDDGVAVIVCPDLQSVAELVAADRLEEPAYMSSLGPISPLDILYGFRPDLARGNHYMAHRTGFTLKTLQNALGNAGFAGFAGYRKLSGFELWVLATKKDVPGSELERLAAAHFPVA